MQLKRATRRRDAERQRRPRRHAQRTLLRHSHQQRVVLFITSMYSSMRVCDVSAACVNVCCVRAVLTEGTAVGDMEIDTDTLDTGCALLWVYPIRS